MPKEVFEKDEFVTLSEKASVCLVKRLGDETKLKLRTPRYLYTIKLPAGEAEEILSQIDCETEEV